MFIKWIGRCGILAMLGLLTNCAAIVSGTDQSIDITSEPSGARCKVVRGSQIVAHVNSTPGSVNVSKSWNDLHIRCKKRGYVTETKRLDSTIQPMTFGNVLIGGLIGFGIDAATGAMRQYPDKQHFVLLPGNFRDEKELNLYFDNLSNNLRRQYLRRSGTHKQNCLDQPTHESCSKITQEMFVALDDKFKDIEARRDRALTRHLEQWATRFQDGGEPEKQAEVKKDPPLTPEESVFHQPFLM